MFLYMRNHTIKYYKNIKLDNGILNDNWFNKNIEERKSYNLLTNKELTFEELGNETNYICIPTFNGNWYSRLNEFYIKSDSLIQSKPYLIIDVRNNGGGNDICVNPLLKYIYTKPFYEDDISIYSTKENIRKSLEWYEKIKTDSINFDNNYLNAVIGEIKQMKSVKNKTFLTRSNGELVALNKPLNNPKKTIIIMNKYCASSCETLLFWALESDKTILVGENSAGYVGYGEIGYVYTPNFNFKLGCTMSRYSKQREFEGIGISPKYYMNNKSDWVEQAVEILKKH